MLDTILKIAIGLLAFTPTALALVLYKIPFFCNFRSGRSLSISFVFLLISLVILQTGAVVGLRFAAELWIPAANHCKIENLSLVFGIAGLLIFPILVLSAWKQ